MIEAPQFKPRADRVITAIALTTFRESIRSKVLYTVMVFAILLVALSTFFGSVTIGDQAQVIADFGLFSISIFSTIFVVISGASHLAKELSKKTIYNILARGVPRWQFLLGKYFGLLATTAVMVALMGSALALYLRPFEEGFRLSLASSLTYIMLELVIVCALAILFSTIVVTPMLSGLFTLGAFLAGRSAEYLLFLMQHVQVSSSTARLLEFLYVIIPNLNKLNALDAAFLFTGATHIFWCGLYAISYSGALLVVAQLIFKHREFH